MTTMSERHQPIAGRCTFCPMESWPCDAIREADRADAAEADARDLAEALRETLGLAILADDGDPWFAQQAGIDAGAVTANAAAILAAHDERVRR